MSILTLLSWPESPFQLAAVHLVHKKTVQPKPIVCGNNYSHRRYKSKQNKAKNQFKINIKLNSKDGDLLYVRLRMHDYLSENRFQP